jgi:polar amino acid transport system substrate-binding protein
MRLNRRLVAASLAVTGAMVLAGCSAGATGDPGATSGGVDPESLQGEYLNPVYIYPPYGFVGDDGELSGLYAEASDALGAELGISISNQEEAWENTLTGLQSGKYLWMTGGEITAERLEAFDWSVINDTFAKFLTPEDGPDIGDDELELCGYTIAALSGSTQAGALAVLAEDCVADGKEPITVGEYKDFAASILALQSGQADLFAADYVSELDVVATDPSLKITGPKFTLNAVGIATTKGSGLAQTIADGINAMIADGTYQALFAKYGVEELMVDKSTVNPQPGE